MHILYAGFLESLLPQDPARRYFIISCLFFFSLPFHGFKVSMALFLMPLWCKGFLCSYFIDCSVIGALNGFLIVELRMQVLRGGEENHQGEMTTPPSPGTHVINGTFLCWCWPRDLVLSLRKQLSVSPLQARSSHRPTL